MSIRTRVFVIAVLALLSLSSVLGQKQTRDRSVSETVALAKDIDDFIDEQNDVATTPQGGALMFVQALIEYSKGTKLGKEEMTNAIFEDDLVDSDLSDMDKYRLERVKEFMARSYIDGTSPDDCYAIPDEDQVRLAFRDQDKYVGSIESGQYKVFIYSGDAELTARPLTLKRNSDGIWKVIEFSSLTLPVQGVETCMDATADATTDATTDAAKGMAAGISAAFPVHIMIGCFVTVLSTVFPY